MSVSDDQDVCLFESMTIGETSYSHLPSHICCWCQLRERYEVNKTTYVSKQQDANLKPSCINCQPGVFTAMLNYLTQGTRELGRRTSRASFSCMDYDRQLAMSRILLGLCVTSLCQTGRLIEQMDAAMSRHSGPYVIVKNRLLIASSCAHVIYICLPECVADVTFFRCLICI